MPATIPPSETSALVVLVLFLAIIARRTIRQIQGARYSVARLAVFAGFYVLLFGALAFSTLYAAVSAWGWGALALLAPYAAIPTVAAISAIPHIRRVAQFEQRENGQWFYRLSWHVPVLYLGLFVARLLAEVAVFGLAGVVVSYPPPVPSSEAGLLILLGVDLLFGVSLGLLLGRGIGVVRAYRDLPATAPAPPSPSRPLPSGRP